MMKMVVVVMVVMVMTTVSMVRDDEHRKAVPLGWMLGVVVGVSSDFWIQV